MAEATFKSLKDCQVVEDQLLTRLTKSVPPAVKLKCLRVAKHCVLKGEISFKRDLQRRLGPIRACLGTYLFPVVVVVVIGVIVTICCCCCCCSSSSSRAPPSTRSGARAVVGRRSLTHSLPFGSFCRVPGAAGPHPRRRALPTDQGRGPGNTHPSPLYGPSSGSAAAAQQAAARTCIRVFMCVYACVRACVACSYTAPWPGRPWCMAWRVRRS